MKKKIFIFSLPVVAVAALVAYLVFGRSSATYLSALPKDARALVRVDLPACFEEAQLTSAEQLQFVQHFMPVDGLEHVGLDWHQPLFAFISQQGNIGFLAAVSEPDDLSRLCVQLYEQGRAGEPTLQRGLTWVVVEQQWLLAFDDVKALVLGPAVGADQERLRTEMAQFMTQKEKDSGQQNVLFTRLHTDKAVSAVVSPDVLPSQARQFLRTLGVHSADDALMLLSLEADGRELKLDAEILAESEEAKDVLNRIGHLLRPVKGTLAAYASAAPLFWLTANMNGDDLLSVLRSDNTVRTALLALNMVFDVDRIIASVDGDIAFEGSHIPSFSQNPMTLLSSLSLRAEVSNTSFLSGAGAWGNALIGVTSLSDHEFALSLGGTKIPFGTEGRVFYLGERRSLAQGDSSLGQQLTADVAGCRLFATLDWQSLHRAEPTVFDVLPGSFRDVERLNVRMRDAGAFTLHLIAPEGTNLSKEILLNE